MRINISLLTLVCFTIISCENNKNEAIDLHPKVTGITYSTPPKMKLIYSNDKIIKIDMFIDEILHSETIFYYTDNNVDSSIYTSYSDNGSRMDSIVSYYTYNNLNQLVRKLDKNLFSFGPNIEEFHYNNDLKLIAIEKYDANSTNAFVDSLLYDDENKLRIYKEFYATRGQTDFTIHQLKEKYEVIKHDDYANPLYHINKMLGVYYSTEFGYMTENNILENTIQNDTPLSYNTADIQYDGQKRVISIDDKIFFIY